MGDKLSHKLLDLGFFSALGTSEHPGFSREETHVGRQTPFTCQNNNGVMVIYDEDARPWIQRTKVIVETSGRKEEIESLISNFNLKWGAYVPHSNDAGNFIVNVLPKL